MKTMGVNTFRKEFLSKAGDAPIKPRLFVDMDGTIAVFKKVDALEALYEKGYFLNLEPIRNVLNAVRILCGSPDVEVCILSSVLSDSEYALKEKNAWLDRYLPGIDAAHRIFPPCGADKKNYIPDGVRANDYLLDDYTNNLILWQPPARGIKLLNGINHTNGTWLHDRIRFDKRPEEIAGNILDIMAGKEQLRDARPGHAEKGGSAYSEDNPFYGKIEYSNVNCGPGETVYYMDREEYRRAVEESFAQSRRIDAKQLGIETLCGELHAYEEKAGLPYAAQSTNWFGDKALYEPKPGVCPEDIIERLRFYSGRGRGEGRSSSEVNDEERIDREADRAINAHEAEYGADGYRAFPGYLAEEDEDEM